MEVLMVLSCCTFLPCLCVCWHQSKSTVHSTEIWTDALSDYKQNQNGIQKLTKTVTTMEIFTTELLTLNNLLTSAWWALDKTGKPNNQIMLSKD